MKKTAHAETRSNRASASTALPRRHWLAPLLTMRHLNSGYLKTPFSCRDLQRPEGDCKQICGNRSRESINYGYVYHWAICPVRAREPRLEPAAWGPMHMKLPRFCAELAE